MPTLHEKMTGRMKRDAAIVKFNLGERMDEDQPTMPGVKPVADPAQQVIELADMTDEQQRIVTAGQTVAGSIPQGLSREELLVWFEETFPTK